MAAASSPAPATMMIHGTATMRWAGMRARIITSMTLQVVTPLPAVPMIAIPVRVTMGAGVIPAAVSILEAAALIRAVAVGVVIAEAAAVVVVIQAVKLIVRRRDTLIVSHRLILF